MAALLTKHNVLFREAVTAAKGGDKIVARALFREVSETEPKSEQAWLWRAALAETAEEILTRLDAVDSEGLADLVQHWMKPALGSLTLGVLGPATCVAAFESLVVALPSYRGQFGPTALAAQAPGSRSQFSERNRIHGD